LAALLNHFQQQACSGSISEIFDGDAPTLPKVRSLVSAEPAVTGLVEF